MKWFRFLGGLLTLTLSGMTMAGVRLGDLTWPEAEAALKERVVVLPFAAGAKEHGPHLPLGTDRLVMDHLLENLMAEREVVVAPPILHGWFPAFREYPGTEVADPVRFQQYVQEVADSLVRHGARRLVILNLGIGRATGLPLSIVARELRSGGGVSVLVLSWEDLEDEASEAVYEQERGGHADEGETSIVLHLRPDLVHMDRAVRDYREPTGGRIGYQPGHFDRSREVGVYGDPTLANAEKGRKILAVMNRNLVAAVDQLAP